MTSRVPQHAPGGPDPISRRKVTAALAAFPFAAIGLSVRTTPATAQTNQKELQPMTPNAFVYTELQASVPFADVPWKELNAAIAAQPGFIDKTWFSGVGNHSVGGLYSFAGVEDALHYCTDFFPALARDFGKTVERNGAQRHMLTRKGVDATLKRLDRLRGSLLRARDKGGVVLVDGHDGIEITTYRLNSYRRSGGKR